MIPLTNPTDTAKALADAPAGEIGPMTDPTSVSLLALGPMQAWFTLYWKVAPPGPGTWDWIGLYPNDWTPDTKFITGANWQWATKGSASGDEMYYQTNTAVHESGYQARYLVWDPDAKLYKSIVRTPAYIGKVCAS